MDKQLREVLDIFHTHGINYWLDNGTLLGLVRDGKLLESDRDLDLTIWSEEEAKLESVLPLFRRLGYHIYKATYRGQTFKYNFTPAAVHTLRTVDVNIYRRGDTHAWCPMYYFKLSPASPVTKHPKDGLAAKIRAVLRPAWKELNAKITLHVAIDKLPWKPFLVIGTWWIPLTFVNRLTYSDQLQVWLPQNVEDYLAFRYGNWRVPQKDWIFYRDDRGIHVQTPSELLKL